MVIDIYYDALWLLVLYQYLYLLIPHWIQCSNDNNDNDDDDGDDDSGDNNDNNDDDDE